MELLKYIKNFNPHQNKMKLINKYNLFLFVFFFSLCRKHNKSIAEKVANCSRKLTVQRIKSQVQV